MQLREIDPNLCSLTLEALIGNGSNWFFMLSVEKYIFEYIFRVNFTKQRLV